MHVTRARPSCQRLQVTRRWLCLLPAAHAGNERESVTHAQASKKHAPACTSAPSLRTVTIKHKVDQWAPPHEIMRARSNSHAVHRVSLASPARRVLSHCALPRCSPMPTPRPTLAVGPAQDADAAEGALDRPGTAELPDHATVLGPGERSGSEVAWREAAESHSVGQPWDAPGSPPPVLAPASAPAGTPRPAPRASTPPQPQPPQRAASTHHSTPRRRRSTSMSGQGRLGGCGLANLGNSCVVRSRLKVLRRSLPAALIVRTARCYLNAVLQALHCCEPVSQYFACVMRASGVVRHRAR